MVSNKESAHLLDTLKHCTHCHLDGMYQFQFFNNKQEPQLRYECLGCRQQFTQGGIEYRKTNRKKFKSPQPRASTPQRPRAPSDADHARARARIAKDAARQAQVEAGGVESAGPPGAQVVTGIRITRGPSGVVPVPPRMLLYQVTIKVAGELDIVRCEMMDLNFGVSDGCQAPKA